MNKPLPQTLGRVIIGIESTTLTDDDKKRLIHPSIGGVILFSRNFISTTQLSELTAQIKQLREPELLIMVDQEGGRVQRFQNNGFTKLPAPYQLLNKHLGHIDTDTVRQRIRAFVNVLHYELKQCGIDLNIAPSVDLYDPKSKVINDRAFSNNPITVTDAASWYLEALSDLGFSSMLKHFPGHGSISEDSHIECATNTKSFESIKQSDLYPFNTLITNESIHTPAIMAAHVLYSKVDKYISTFSAFWLTDYLRKTLGFNGLVFSDDMEMFAAQQSFSNHYEAISCFYKAGGDIALLCNNFSAIDAFLTQPPMICDHLQQAKLEKLKAHPDHCIDYQAYLNSLDFLKSENLL